ncbi:MAG: hypothetical protein A3C02_02405 [Candidatus Andersenbacteria bacterium RIFCSPHIGHO2_02_FULL_45_11]|nr:MAG: hypothetical protein A3C02_02405 [Candidatus Andersenbacteria bacterium RIFCSPHIGHO2_02_FULL_45_11]
MESNMPMPKYTANSLRKFIVGIIVALFIAIGLLAGTRLQERIAYTQTPDDTHIHQVYAKNPIKTEFIATAQGLSGVAIARQESSVSDNAIIAQIYNNIHVAIPSSLTVTPTELKLSFNPQPQSAHQKFTVTIETSANKQAALLLPYESDSTKYPNTIVWQNGIQKQGSLGITQYERPTIALSLARWLGLPHQRALWLGIGLCVVGFALRRTPSRSPLSKGEKLRDAISSPHMRGGDLPAGQAGVGSRSTVAYYVIVFISILIVYWPATKLFFYSDDVPILARTEVLKSTNPLLLFTPHQYTDSDPNSQFGFDFWRPVSFSAYPLLLSYLPGRPNAQVYYFVNIVLLAITGCLLFTIAHHILKSPAFALLATAIWAFHSTKLGVVYWWSSSQDILASLFAMGTIVLYLKNKYKLAMMCYMLGMLSKEYVIVTPILIAGIELLSNRGFQVKPAYRTGRPGMTGFVITAGIFLILNTAALGNPWIFKDTHADTYAFSLNPISIARNIIVYTSASAEDKLWPTTKASNSLELFLDTSFELWRAKTSGPYYPGVVLIMLWLIGVFAFFKNTNVRNTLIFGGIWWTLYLGPILLLANDWKPRWLTLPIFGIGLCGAMVLQRLRIPKLAIYTLVLLSGIYGYQTARAEHLIRFYREQSEYTRNAYHQLRKQEELIQGAKRIILIGITEEQETSLNAYLFRVYAKNPHADIIYAASMPPRQEPGDIIINMSGVIPYYPESEK